MRSSVHIRAQISSLLSVWTLPYSPLYAAVKDYLTWHFCFSSYLLLRSLRPIAIPENHKRSSRVWLWRECGHKYLAGNDLHFKSAYNKLSTHPFAISMDIDMPKVPRGVNAFRERHARSTNVERILHCDPRSTMDLTVCIRKISPRPGKSVLAAVRAVFLLGLWSGTDYSAALDQDQRRHASGCDAELCQS